MSSENIDPPPDDCSTSTPLPLCAPPVHHRIVCPPRTKTADNRPAPEYCLVAVSRQLCVSTKALYPLCLRKNDHDRSMPQSQVPSPLRASRKWRSLCPREPYPGPNRVLLDVLCVPSAVRVVDVREWDAGRCATDRQGASPASAESSRRPSRCVPARVLKQAKLPGWRNIQAGSGLPTATGLRHRRASPWARSAFPWPWKSRLREAGTNR